MSALLFALLLTILSTSLLLPAVNAWGHNGPPTRHWPDYDDYSRCDHNGSHTDQMGWSDDTWTGCGVRAYYRDNQMPAYYTHATWYFERGYGGGYGGDGYYANYTVSTNYFICTYTHDVYVTTYYSYGYPSNDGWDWHQNDQITLNPFNPSLATSVQGCSSSWFKDPNNPSNQWYISSPIYMAVVT